jgi:arylsulfatase
MKWRNYKVHLIWQERMYDAPQKLAVPRLVNLYDNPQERPEETTGESAVVTHGWILHAMFGELAKFQESLKKYPPILPGASDPYTPPSAR